MTDDVSQAPGATPDAQQELLAALADLVPSAFPDGVLDFGLLLDALGESDSLGASFSFTWPGIEQARLDARAATTATLVPDPDASLNWATARNVLIEGDNLQVLKLLKSGYSAAVKLIYIDPPYNTGDTFTYNDDFSVPESEYLKATGQVDEQGNVTTSKLEKVGKKHAPWLSMMFPRLAVARHLLRRDGVILVSIDNNEVHHLRLLLDAVFGAANFVDMFTWRGARKGDAKLTGGGQDYILVYARDREWLKANDVRWRERKEGLEPIYARVDELRAEHGSDYVAITKGLREWYRSLSDDNPSKAHAHYARVDERGIWFPDNISSPNYRENLIYDWKGYSPPDNGWRYERSRMEELDADGRLIYPEDKSKRVQIKAYLHTREDWAPPSVFYRDRRAASTQLDELMGSKVFDDPKSTDVLARLVHSLTGDGDLVVDFFAGSGSTGHAIWEQNPRDGKVRRWILVQVPEKPDDSEESGRNAIKAGYKTIFEITADRLRRAAKAIGDDSLGFRIFRSRETNLVIDKPVIAEEGMTGQTYIEAVLSNAQGSPVAKGACDEAVAWEVVLKATGTKLDATVTTHDVNGITVYEFVQTDGHGTGRLFVSLGAFSIDTADALGVGNDDILILRGDKVDDSTTLTLAPRLQKNLVLLERVAREVSL
ncbi:site-specific DNA-methyltransferase [Nocardia gamkensis]|uniref:Site-specific DNA-methyltransferase n=1 Tax=Nocardia gamkensis TaxID=352869 RepID=A0A7X6R798_9NOCA|nr:site-specific DNA-methyltransferase [Nocardia gamkensis]NKY31373.1 site-specific DNA-methyltransferase [Nocardia gamkensis]NQE72444.1 Type III restriction-modification system EcoPI enzyme mod [Nocardia gamkensis]